MGIRMSGASIVDTNSSYYGYYGSGLYSETSYMLDPFNSGNQVIRGQPNHNGPSRSDWIKCRFCNRRNRISESDGACKFCLGDLEIDDRSSPFDRGFTAPTY